MHWDYMRTFSDAGIGGGFGKTFRWARSEWYRENRNTGFNVKRPGSSSPWAANSYWDLDSYEWGKLIDKFEGMLCFLRGRN